MPSSIQAEAEAMAAGVRQGTFVSKVVKGSTYWYLQRMEGDRKRQHYLGRESPALLSWMEDVRQARSRSAADEAQRANLSSMLAAGGALRESARVAKVLSLLADSEVFRRGGVLVGTQAFASYGNMLGVRFESQSLRTQDVDIDQDQAIGIALPQEVPRVNVERSLTESGLGFFPVPALDPRLPSTSFKIRGRELRVDFLTPMIGPESTKPVFLPALGVSAHPLRLLDYLIRESTQAVVLGGSGILVNVPDPTRFAFHKLWISGKRPVSEQTTATKDLRQASDLLEVLVSDRPGDLPAAWEELTRSPSVAKTVRLAISRLSSGLQEGFGSAGCLLVFSLSATKSVLLQLATRHRSRYDGPSQLATRRRHGRASRRRLSSSPSAARRTSMTDRLKLRQLVVAFGNPSYVDDKPSQASADRRLGMAAGRFPAPDRPPPRAAP